MEKNKKEAWLVYDGDCPVCQNYVKFFRVRDNVNLHLIDARVNFTLRNEIDARGWDIDEGMVLKVGDELYYGSEAIHVLALLGTSKDLVNKLNYVIFASKPMARIVYPLCKQVRTILLWALRIPKIRDA